MDRIVLDFLNAESLAPEYPGTIADTLLEPAAPEHVAPIIQTPSGFRLGQLEISHPLDPTRVEFHEPKLNRGERFVGIIRGHPGHLSDELVQSVGIDLPTARAVSNEPGTFFRASYVVGPSGKGPYFGVSLFEPRPVPGTLSSLGVGP